MHGPVRIDGREGHDAGLLFTSRSPRFRSLVRVGSYRRIAPCTGPNKTLTTVKDSQ